MENNLPNGWTARPLKDVVSSRKGKKPNTVIDYAKKGYDPYILIDELEGNSPRTYTNDSKIPRAAKKDVLLVWDGSIGKCASGLSGAVGSTIVVLSPKNGLNTKYLEYFIKRSKNYITETSTGSGLQHVNKSLLKTLEIPLPPDGGQKRIADKLDVLLSKVKDAQSRLENIPLILNRFRQSVLAAAFSGKFIETEYKEKIMGDLDIKIQTGPFGSTLHKSDYVEGGIAVINPMHIVDSEIRPSDKVTINKNTLQRLKNYVLHKGDVVLARRGEMGRCAVVDVDSEGYLCGTGSLFLRFDKNKIDPYYLQTILSSPPSVNYLSDNSVGTTMQNLNQSILKEMTIPLPPVLEQKKVVRKVKSLFDIVRVIETRYHESTKYTDKLEQSILAKAFRGELVK